MRFWTIFRHHLRGRRTAIIGWGASLFVLAAYLLELHDAFISQQEQFHSLITPTRRSSWRLLAGRADLFTPTAF